MPRAPARRWRLCSSNTRTVPPPPFHPAFQFEDTELDDADNLTNRAPYATLHLLREDSIDRAVESGDSAEDIVERNLGTCARARGSRAGSACLGQ